MYEAATAEGHRRQVAGHSPSVDRTALVPAQGTTGARQADAATVSCPCGGGCPRCAAAGGGTATLAISRPDDRWEVEADRIAGAPAGYGKSLAHTGYPPARESGRRAARTEAAIRSARFGAGSALPAAVQQEATAGLALDFSSVRILAGDGPDADTASAGVRQVLTRPGRALEPRLRADMERRFGHDFGQVRIHTDANAAASARAVSAQAYTVGHHVVFADGRYDPGGEEGRALLIHELAHTIQQSAVASAAVPPQKPIMIEPPGTSLERAAEESASRLTGNPGALGAIHGIALQRQPAPPPQTERSEEPSGEPLLAVFIADQGKRRDKRFARKQAQTDAARIRKSGTLSADDRQLVHAKLRFFEGDAWHVYAQAVRPALIEVTREEIQMPGDDLSGTATSAIAQPTPKPGDIADRINMLRRFPEYVDNNIKEVNFFTAELAVIHYEDGSVFELGLVPKWMKPPVVEVDYWTPVEDLMRFEDATTGRIGFMIKSELANAPPSTPYRDLLKTYVHYVDFSVAAGTGRIIPSRINMLTAPTLCGVLLDSLRRWEEQVDVALKVGLGGTMAIGPYAGAGGLPVGSGVAATNLASRAATRAALSPTARTLAREMDALLAHGGSKTIEAEGLQFMRVEVSRQGSVLAVRRFMSKLPEELRGAGTGARMAREFEEAAVEVGRLNGAKTVTIDVGIIINLGWRKLLEARGYVHELTEGRWVKTINL